MTLTHQSLLVIDPDKVTATGNDPCFEEPKVMGMCKAAIPKWSFVLPGRCEEFTYGGCGGTRELLHLHVGLLPGL